MKIQNWSVAARYAASGKRPGNRRHPAPEDFRNRSVVGPANALTVEAVLDLLEVPESGRAPIRGDGIVQNFVADRLVPDQPYPHHAAGMYYVSDAPDAQLVEWEIEFTFITRLITSQETSRDQRQAMIASWAEMAFGRDEATSLPQRGLRLLEEAIEAFQACGGDEEIAHKLVAFVFGRPKGEISQELGGVAVTTLALAAAAGVSADDEECREIRRVLSKPLGEFAQRNANKNAAGFKIP